MGVTGKDVEYGVTCTDVETTCQLENIGIDGRVLKWIRVSTGVVWLGIGTNVNIATHVSVP
jgi:hypothetical protein